MQNVATIIAGEGFKLNLEKANEIAGDLEHSGGFIENIVELSKGTAYDIYFSRINQAEAREIYNASLEGQNVDFIVQGSEGRKKKLIISDMDSTIIEQECLDEIAGELGIKEKIAAITDRAMNGELDFKEALRERVGLLKGLDASSLQKVYDSKITFTKGAVELVKTMRANGAFCVLVSGGFTFFTSRVAAHCGFHVEEANILEIENGKLTGKVKEPILDATSKLNSLLYHTEDQKLSLFNTIAIGDGANDLPMILKSGFGIAFSAKPNVKKQAIHKIDNRDLRAVLYAQGYKEDEIIS